MAKPIDGVKKRALEKIKETQKEFIEKIITLILGSFGFVAALAWNEAIKGLLENFLGKSEGLIGKFIYAIIVTLMLVLISIRLKKISEQGK